MAEHMNINKCGICLLPFDDPKILPCFHTFCAKCLENNVAATRQWYSFKCPMCRTVTEIPEGGVKAFQSNFYVNSNNGFVSDVDCDGCGQQRKASRKCLECDQHFCEHCTGIHARTSATKHHQLCDIISESIQNKPCILRHCQTHLCTYVSLCNECIVLCCRECTLTTHRQHSFSSIASAACEKRTVLRHLIDQSEQNTQENESDACAMRRQNEAKFKFFSNEIEHLRKQKNALVAKINEEFEHFEHETGAINVEQRTKADEITRKQLAKCEFMKETENKSKSLLDSEDDIGLLGAFEELASHLKANETKMTPCVPGHKLMENVDQCTSWLVKLNQACKELAWQGPSQITDDT